MFSVLSTILLWLDYTPRHSTDLNKYAHKYNANLSILMSLQTDIQNTHFSEDREQHEHNIGVEEHNCICPVVEDIHNVLYQRFT